MVRRKICTFFPRWPIFFCVPTPILCGRCVCCCSLGRLRGRAFSFEGLTAFNEGFSLTLALVLALAFALGKVGFVLSTLPFILSFSFSSSIEAGVVAIVFGGVSRTFSTGLKASSSAAFSFSSALACTSQLRPPLEASSDERLVLVDMPEDVFLIIFGYEALFKGLFILYPIAELTVIIPRVEDCERTSAGIPAVFLNPRCCPCTLLRKRGSASPVLVVQKSSNTWDLTASHWYVSIRVPVRVILEIRRSRCDSDKSAWTKNSWASKLSPIGNSLICSRSRRAVNRPCRSSNTCN